MMSRQVPLAPSPDAALAPAELDDRRARRDARARSRACATWRARARAAPRRSSLAMAWLLEDETLDAVVAGGTDGLCRLTLSGFNALAAIDPEPCRPFDAHRRGLNLGEGAGFLVLERASVASAAARRRSPSSRAASLGAGGAPHHEPGERAARTRRARHARGARRARALRAGELDYVNAHGTAHAAQRRDGVEGARAVLGAETLARPGLELARGRSGTRSPRRARSKRRSRRCACSERDLAADDRSRRS